eukprot:3931869-Rhodomonas_salina.1
MSQISGHSPVQKATSWSRRGRGSSSSRRWGWVCGRRLSWRRSRHIPSRDFARTVVIAIEGTAVRVGVGAGLGASALCIYAAIPLAIAALGSRRRHSRPWRGSKFP